jgi:hypothetical protein
MKAREINLGNWLDNGEGTNYVIDTSSMIDIMDEAQMNNGETSWVGIPLTEEWLVKFGMFNGKDYTYANYSLKKGNYAISDTLDCGWSIGIQTSTGWMFLVCVDYVHELQNAIFSLTRDELAFTNTNRSQNVNIK